MHHKRKGPKSARAGCLLCKPYKRQGARLSERQRHSVRKALDGQARDVAEAVEAPVAAVERPPSEPR